MRFYLLAIVILLTASLGRLSLSQHLEVDPLPLMGDGVVVEKVGPGSSLERAGIQPGDRLFYWRRLPNPPANPEGASGEIESLFDWKWLVVEQAPRGAVEVVGEREGGRKIFTAPMGSWESDVRPGLPEGLLAAYLEGRELIEAREFDEAGEVWLGLGESLQETSDWRLRCGLLLRMGEVWAEAREWERARIENDFALEMAGDWKSRAEIWSVIGENHRSQRHYQEAHAAFHKVLRLQEKKAPGSLGVARSLLYLGSGAKSQGDLKTAIRFHQQALTVREKLAPGSLEVAQSLDRLGFVAKARSDLSGATEYHLRALAIRRHLVPGSLDVANSLGTMGRARLLRGDLGAATEYFKRGMAIKVHLAPHSRTMAGSLVNLGTVAFLRGDLDAAATYYRGALAVLERLVPGSIDVEMVLESLGWVANQSGDLTTATTYYQRALAVWQRPIPGGVHLAFLLQKLGNLATQRGDLNGAANYFRRIPAVLAEPEPDDLITATGLVRLGNAAAEYGDLAAAAEYCQRALEIQKSLLAPGLPETSSLVCLGNAATQRGDLDRAAEHLLRALEILERLAPNSSREVKILKDLGAVRHQTGQLEESLLYYLRSLRASESQIRKLGGTETVRAGFRARNGEGHHGAIEVLLELNRPQEAISILERSRARSFLTLLAERDLRFGADVPAELDEARSRLAVLHDRTLRQLEDLSPEQEPDEHLTLTKKLRTLRREYEENAEDIKRSSPRLAALQYPEPLDLEEILETLDPGTLMLSYSVGEAQVDVFAVSQAGGLQVKTIPFGEAELREKVDSFLKSVGKSKRLGTERGAAQLANLQRMGEYLYGKLILPVENLVGESDRLLILPDGPLHRLPFGALVRPVAKGDIGIGRDWQYLVEWKPLHQALSATVFAELKKRRPSTVGQEQEASIQISAFGDPAYSDSSEGLSGEPSEALQGVGNLEAARARSAFRGCGFKHNPLPHTRREVEEIAALYPGTKSYLGAEATEEAAKALGPDTNILHFAAHGCVDDNLPLNSAVVLTMPKGFPEDRDNGLLQVWEIFERVRLKADLVVLSACQSGLGQELRGEGLIGLTRAFQYAGARTVAATLWRVDDQVTTELMVRFYRHLKSGKAKDEALRAAQMELIKAPISVETPDGQTVERDVSSPYYWAAFQLYGDWF